MASLITNISGPVEPLKLQTRHGSDSIGTSQVPLLQRGIGTGPRCKHPCSHYHFQKGIPWWGFPKMCHYSNPNVIWECHVSLHVKGDSLMGIPQNASLQESWHHVMGIPARLASLTALAFMSKSAIVIVDKGFTLWLSWSLLKANLPVQVVLQLVDFLQESLIYRINISCCLRAYEFRNKSNIVASNWKVAWQMLCDSLKQFKQIDNLGSDRKKTR